jgi:hypothetical protein
MSFFIGEKYFDDAVMYNILEGINFYSGTERKKMLKVSDKVGGSMLYGNTWKGFLKRDSEGNKVYRPRDPASPCKYLTKVKSENPELADIFKEYANLYFPNFEYKQVQMNKNYPCPPHNDRNKGDSVLVAFGEYTGGNLVIQKENKNIEYDGRLSPIRFNGKNHLHWVLPFSGGDRYSLVFFNN